MDKVFIVTSGEYSDYRIDGVFTAQDMAEEFSIKFGGGNIEEWGLNPDIPQLREGLTGFRVFMRRDGTVVEVLPDKRSSSTWGSDRIMSYEGRKWYPPRFPWQRDRYGLLCGNCYAKDAQHAIKIINDRRAFMIAEGLYPEPPKIEEQ